MGSLQQVQGTPNGNHGDLSSEVFTQQIGVAARKLLFPPWALLYLRNPVHTSPSASGTSTEALLA